MNTSYLQYLLTIAECGSISKASNQLNLKQQYLSHVVKSLEDEFNITIFQRHSRGVSTTEDGEVFLAQAKQVTKIVNQMHLQYQYPSKQHVQEEQLILNLYVTPLLQPTNLNKAITVYHSCAHAKINYTESFLEDCIQQIVNQPYSIGLQITSRTLAQLQDILPQQLLAIKLCPSTLVVLTGKQNADKQNLKEISLEELLQKELISFAPKGLKASALYQILSRYGELKNILSVENHVIFTTLLENENYYTIGSPKVAENNNNLTAIPISDYKNTSFTNVAIVQKEMFTSPVIRDFINILLLQIGEPTL